jgi:hypothetical protein
MAIHDWTKMEAGDFHDFHQCWVIALRNALNRGLLPPDYMAMAEQVTGRPIPDVVTLHCESADSSESGGIAVASAPPSARWVTRSEKINYARRADRIVIRHGRGKVVAIIEIVSPGNTLWQTAHRGILCWGRSPDGLRRIRRRRRSAAVAADFSFRCAICSSAAGCNLS